MKGQGYGFLYYYFSLPTYAMIILTETYYMLDATINPENCFLEEEHGFWHIETAGANTEHGIVDLVTVTLYLSCLYCSLLYLHMPFISTCSVFSLIFLPSSHMFIFSFTFQLFILPPLHLCIFFFLPFNFPHPSSYFYLIFFCHLYFYSYLIFIFSLPTFSVFIAFLLCIHFSLLCHPVFFKHSSFFTFFSLFFLFSAFYSSFLHFFSFIFLSSFNFLHPSSIFAFPSFLHPASYRSFSLTVKCVLGRHVGKRACWLPDIFLELKVMA